MLGISLKRPDFYKKNVPAKGNLRPTKNRKDMIIVEKTDLTKKKHVLTLKLKAFCHRKIILNRV